MKILKTNDIAHPDGSRFALIQRENPYTPYIACRLDGNDTPRLEQGFQAFTSIGPAISYFEKHSRMFDSIFRDLKHKN